MRFMQIESVLQTINRSEPAKNRFSVALNPSNNLSMIYLSLSLSLSLSFKCISQHEWDVL